MVYEDETSFATIGPDVKEYSLPQYLLKQLEEMEPAVVVCGVVKDWARLD